MFMTIDERDLPKPTERQPHAWTDEEIGKALVAKRGLQYLAADLMNMSYTHMSRRISESDYLKSIRDQCLQKRLDVAEESLSELNQEKDLGSLCFFLKTIGRTRGYTETTQVTADPEMVQRQKDLMNQISNLQEALKSDDKSNNAETKS